ncbi:MAG: hypothetical protein HQM08_22050 [Candidatus Riflebacteria bacterium]|nr:hypothetical protein [Candidatus Riflebacteria bacterium]
MRPSTGFKSGLIPIILMATFILVGCSDSAVNKGGGINPMSSYQPSTTSSTLPTNGTTQTPGALDKPVVSVPTSTGTTSSSNAPLLDNLHPGWQQSACFNCHTDQSRIRDHNYADTSLCYLCHGTNGLPGFGDSTPPVIKGIIAGPTLNSVSISWTTDEPAICRLIVRTVDGDRMDFPVSSDYKTSHRYTVNGLLPKTTYSYEISATDRSNNVSNTTTIGNLTFTTLEPVVSPTGTSTGTATGTAFFQNILLTVIDSYNVKVKFTTTELCLAKVNVEILSLGTVRTFDGPTTPVTNFDINCDGLYASSSYRLYITGTDMGGVLHTSSPKKSFQTPPATP